MRHPHHRDLPTWREALDAVLAACSPLPALEVPLEQARGRTLAEEVLADAPIPSFANSAMDGFAVRTADLDAGPRSLPLVALIPAGAAPPALAPGHAAPIATGAPIPDGSDAVVPVEEAELRDGRVYLPGPVMPGRNIRAAGSDVGAGDRLLAPGTVLGPAEAALLAAVGRVRVRTHRPPRVAVVATGSELVPPGTAPGPGQIRDSNSTALAWACRAAGAEVIPLGAVPDEPEAIRERLARGLEADVLVSSGGVSVGELDLVRAALASLGVEEVIPGVRLKPGKPLAFGVRGRTLVFGLPGNPASAQVGLTLFVLPALRALAGNRSPAPRLEPAVAAGTWPPATSRDHAVRCRLDVEAGRLLAVPTGGQGSHRISSLVGAEALALVPPDRAVTPGDPVSVVRPAA